MHIRYLCSAPGRQSTPLSHLLSYTTTFYLRFIFLIVSSPTVYVRAAGAGGGHLLYLPVCAEEPARVQFVWN